MIYLVDDSIIFSSHIAFLSKQIIIWGEVTNYDRKAAVGITD